MQDDAPKRFTLLHQLYLTSQASRRFMRSALAGTGLTGEQYALYSYLYGNRPRTLSQAARDFGLAVTTVATMLKVMLEKGLVERRQGERGYQWTAKVSRQSAESGLTHKLIERLFDGSARRLVAHLIEEGKLSAADQREIQEMLDRSSVKNAKKRRKRGGEA